MAGVKDVFKKLGGNRQKAQELIQQHENEPEVIPAGPIDTKPENHQTTSNKKDMAQMMRDVFRP